MCSASMKHTLAPDVVRSTILEGKPIRKLFSKEQRAFYAAHAPEGIELDDLSVLGPIFVLKVKTYPETLRPQAGRRAVDSIPTARGSSSCRRSACRAKASI